MATPDPRRGEIWWVDWSPGRGSEQAGRRPALVVQTDAANSNPRYPNTVIATISTKGRNVPTHVQVEATPANGLTATSFVKCEQSMTISKARLESRAGFLDRQAMQRVEVGMRLVLEL